MSITVTVELRDRLVDALRLSPGGAPAAWSAELWSLVAQALPPAPLEPGDRVQSRSSAIPRFGTVLAVHGDRAWVQWSGTAGPATVHFDAIARVDEAAS